MERIEFGEECDYHLVSDILGQAISLWNQTVEKLREMLSEPETLLKQLQCCLSEDGPEDLANESHLDRLVEKVQQKLCIVELKNTAQNYMKLSFARM